MKQFVLFLLSNKLVYFIYQNKEANFLEKEVCLSFFKKIT